MTEWKRADELEDGSRVAWCDSDTGPIMLADLVGAGELAPTSGRYRVIVRLRDGSVRSATMDAAQEIQVVARPAPKATKAPAAGA
jgi:hypothetical protein